MKRHIVVLALVLAGVTGATAADGVSGTLPASLGHVWSVTLAVLEQLGWDIDKADRGIGWITTDSRKLEGTDYGVYAKGTRHRLRVIIKDAGAGKTAVTVERTLFQRERILFIDNDEVLPTNDRSVEQSVLDAISKGL